jgi:hypothetical protein
MPSICLVYGLGVALGGLPPFLVIPVRDHLGGKRLMAAGRKRRCQGRFRQYDEAVSMVWS